MKNLLIITICLISCENKTIRKDCIINFEIPEDVINSERIATNLKFDKNILSISVSNLRKDTLHFAAPYLVFVKEAIQHDTEESDVVKPFIPNVVTNRVITYRVTKDNKKETIRIDSSKTRDLEQYEAKLAPKEKLITEYVLNCKESDSERYKVYFFESNKFESDKYMKIKYPENAYLEIKKEK